jgi:hypothetical protein
VLAVGHEIPILGWMSDVAWIVLAAVLTPAIARVVAGAVIEPHEPWKGVFESAAAAAGLAVALLGVATIALMVLHPSNGHGDQEAGVQLIFVALLAVPLYAPALVGAAIGKLLARQLSRRQAG